MPPSFTPSRIVDHRSLQTPQALPLTLRCLLPPVPDLSLHLERALCTALFYHSCTHIYCTLTDAIVLLLFARRRFLSYHLLYLHVPLPPDVVIPLLLPIAPLHISLTE